MNKLFMAAALIFISCTGERLVSPEDPPDPRIPEEAPFKEKGIHIPQIPADFTSGIAWFQVVHNDNIASYSTVEVDWLRFYVVVNGQHILLCEDQYDTWDSSNQGGLYIRYPWFPIDGSHEPMEVTRKASSIAFSPHTRKDRVWHWWCSSRSVMPKTYDYIYLKIRIKLAGGPCFQAGFDWHKTQTSVPQWNVTLKEVGFSDWYFASPDWQIITLESK